MKNKNILLIIILSLSSFIMNAQRSVFQKEALRIRSGETKFSILNTGLYVDRISFEAKASGISKNCVLVMSADGFHRTTVKIAGTGWKTYIAEFSEFTRSIEILNNSQRGVIRVKNIQILPRRLSSKGGYTGPAYDYISTGSDAYYQVANLKNTIDYLFHLVSQNDRVKYIDPFIIILGDAMSVLETSSDLSSDARESVSQVVSSLNEMDSFLNSLLQTPNLSDLGREMKSTKRLLARMLQN